MSAAVATSLRTLTEIWRGDGSWDRALRSGRVVVTAAEHVRRAVPQWLGQSTLAATPRPALPSNGDAAESVAPQRHLLSVSAAVPGSPQTRP
ncbi:MAG TPA: hypothetical protein VHM65_03350 [Candidatus Lustribacter sp.]|nr:hypothetical protein [Candidatus Lustribacter sp.]